MVSERNKRGKGEDNSHSVPSPPFSQEKRVSCAQVTKGGDGRIMDGKKNTEGYLIHNLFHLAQRPRHKCTVHVLIDNEA